jgi:hypothetical protein
VAIQKTDKAIVKITKGTARTIVMMLVETARTMLMMPVMTVRIIMTTITVMDITTMIIMNGEEHSRPGRL